MDFFFCRERLCSLSSNERHRAADRQSNHGCGLRNRLIAVAAACFELAELVQRLDPDIGTTGNRCVAGALLVDDIRDLIERAIQVQRIAVRDRHVKAADFLA